MDFIYHKRGQKCEALALKYFTDLQYTLINKNKKIFEVEIDLIFKKENIFYFVEVKSNNFWRVENPIHKKQMERLIEAAEMFSETYHVSTRLILAIVNEDRRVQVYSLDEYL